MSKIQGDSGDDFMSKILVKKDKKKFKKFI